LDWKGKFKFKLHYLTVHFQNSEEGPVYVAEVLANLTKDSAKSRNSAMIKPQASNLGEMQVGWVFI